MPLDCTTDCRFCKPKQDHTDTASSSEGGSNASSQEEEEEDSTSSSSSLSLLKNTSNISSTLETIYQEARPTPEAPDDAFTRKEISTHTLSEQEKNKEDDNDDDISISMQLPSPSSVYSSDSPFENDNSVNGFQGSGNDNGDWSFLDDVHFAIVAWLDAGGLEMARLGYVPPVFPTSLGLGGPGRRRHSV